MKFNDLIKKYMTEDEDKIFKQFDQSEDTIRNFVQDILVTFKNRLGKKDVYELSHVKELMDTFIIPAFNKFPWEDLSPLVKDYNKDKIYYFKNVINQFFDSNTITVRDKEKIDSRMEDFITKISDPSLSPDEQQQIMTDWTTWLDSDDTKTEYDLFQYLDQLEVNSEPN
jgi:hypothetical protein